MSRRAGEGGRAGSGCGRGAACEPGCFGLRGARLEPSRCCCIAAWTAHQWAASLCGTMCNHSPPWRSTLLKLRLLSEDSCSRCGCPPRSSTAAAGMAGGRAGGVGAMHVGRPDARAASPRRQAAGRAALRGAAQHAQRRQTESLTLGGVVVGFHADVARVELDGQGEVLPVGVRQRNVDCRQQAVCRGPGTGAVPLMMASLLNRGAHAVARSWQAHKSRWTTESATAAHLPV